MKTNILDTTILGTSCIAGLTHFLDSYAGFLLTASSAILVGYIRFQEHKKNMDIMELDRKIKQKMLEE
ncbi:MAG: hypothetical protein AAGJ93_11290 [Bacteroidota bacterium]